MILIKRTLGVLIILLLFGNTTTLGQDELPSSKLPKYLLFHLSFSFQKPGADMGDRYGNNLAAGLGIDYLTSKNFIFGIQTDYLFGRNVKEDVLVNLRTSDGDIIGNNAAISNIKLTERGWNGKIVFGKLFDFNKKNPRSGIRATLGIGFLQHKIRIQQDPQSLVPQTTGIYAKGYDRLSNGLAFSQFIGYQKVSSDRTINLILGIELTQGLTQNRRAFNFDQQVKDDNKYFDFLLGGKFSWTIPFEIGRPSEEIFY